MLRVAPDRALEPLRAARFFMLRRLDRLSPDIPRPFSVYRQLEDGELEFLIKVMGAGDRRAGGEPAGGALVDGRAARQRVAGDRPGQ